MIARVYKLNDGTVMTFDETGEMLNRFSGLLMEDLREDILCSAPPDTQFFTYSEESEDAVSIPRSEF